MAANTPIIAKAIHVEGEVNFFSIMDRKIKRVKVGDVFAAGDRIVTAADGIVEIKFDTGDLVRVDKNTNMIIKSLHRNGRGATFSIFHLFAGRVKSAVSRLATKNSKFEYHTKTAICGVGGTPPWVLRVHENKAEIDLLGKKGDKGFIYVRGFDPKKTLVTLFAGNRTIVRPGMPPIRPFPISRQRLQMLKRTIPFKTKPEVKKEVKEKPKKAAKDKDKKQEAAPYSIGRKLVTSAISQRISTPKQPKPGEAKSVDSTNTQSTSGQGAVGQYGETGGGSPPQPARVKIRINLQ